MQSGTPGLAGYDLCGAVPSKHMDAPHCFDLHIHIHRHLKYPYTKSHTGIRMQAIWKIIYIVIYSGVLFYTVSCVPEAKVNHVIPCLSIM